ncbi:high mobility group 20A [Brachionus plicatilis]|uniref:High mobility group 20A n=1 Tax=Brachionus plicatilis TaxID=10195 RepID=A0A3M7PX12_BRAPC|nr:high mobility group 20A [Brachionus plicatilis]
MDPSESNIVVEEKPIESDLEPKVEPGAQEPIGQAIKPETVSDDNPHTKLEDYTVLENRPEILPESAVEPTTQNSDFVINEHEIKHQVALNENSFINQSIKEESIEATSSQTLTEPTTPAKTTPKTTSRKKPRTSANKSNQSNNIMNTINDIASGTTNVSPPSAQKRRKKDPSAPKAPLNGYLVYFNEERSEMRVKNPNIGFGELTKIIAAKWKELPADEKQKYINEAELDKERYNKEMADYKKSDAYRQYLKENSNSKAAKASVDESSQSAPIQGDQPNVSWLQTETNVAGFDIPIFTEEFIEHSKVREQELRQLRKEVNELEQQNGVLNKHIDNLKVTSQKIDKDSENLKNSNVLMQKNIDLFRHTVMQYFAQVSLPNSADFVPNSQNIDEYIVKLFQLVELNNQFEQSQNVQDSNYLMNRNFVSHVKSVFSKINFNSLFENV